jgi:hypothetical protein
MREIFHDHFRSARRATGIAAIRSRDDAIAYRGERLDGAPDGPQGLSGEPLGQPENAPGRRRGVPGLKGGECGMWRRSADAGGGALQDAE